MLTCWRVFFGVCVCVCVCTKECMQKQWRLHELGQHRHRRLRGERVQTEEADIYLTTRAVTTRAHISKNSMLLCSSLLGNGWAFIEKVDTLETSESSLSLPDGDGLGRSVPLILVLECLLLLSTGVLGKLLKSTKYALSTLYSCSVILDCIERERQDSGAEHQTSSLSSCTWTIQVNKTVENTASIPRTYIII